MCRALSRSQLQKVVSAITKWYPTELADSAWDNVGLLIDCSITSEQSTSTIVPKVLLTVDLTQDVAQEAVDKECNVIIAYHPFIFPSFKNIAPTKNPQHRSLLKLIQNNISVYSPHTAVDAARGGVNDWLVDGLIQFKYELIAKTVAIERTNAYPSEEDIGYGRLLSLTGDGIKLSDIVSSIKQNLHIPHLQISSDYQTNKDKMIKTVALCAGSGSGVFKALSQDQQDEVDLYYTGELSHHEVLRLKELGKTVITCNHSNTERGYLAAVMQKKLSDQGLSVSVSSYDHDPLYVV
ncbi:similar to Saccharomyces cerevisiae YGL221C NIF3 Protein of unknown function, similar to Listeria monocytogenes major sigma factor (rpoD gene product) [Maudiozyma barnettii]|uniref:Uncharacterized protein n=1 Tax=Maudiozyma barnettii TaxID=61262 RepID=A0A8H2VB12_9SACH|nr:hypothetical protein [Kazachstania barnettii]CAB4251978.1 similar to Saccharomyces cerevisiae YGL221C NIF3 Protein of unknown function, similar to Listeria monocytogenes major sigma factor (rpoD gene product) [Kazachstania barnettii]CAD1778375.1 similar to Saccharomyces cerevisiae YGL221C NIF3 Protein of unknown function, similar to Listeria monocytogenes major sigma factor (rpoD gene product) [Kazachstania barnettii]